MSLINKVLINIDKQQEVAEQVKPQASYDGLSPVARSDYRPIITLVVAIMAAGAVGVFIWIQLHKPNTQLPEVQVVTATPLPIESRVAHTSPVPYTENVSTPTPTESVVDNIPVPTQPQPVIQTVHDVVAKATQTSGKTQKAKKMLAGQEAAPSIPVAKVSGAQVATSLSATSLATEVADNDVVKTSKQDKQPKSPASKAASMKITSTEQRSDNLYRQALLYMQQLQTTEAKQALRQAIAFNPENHNARQLLAELMIDAGQNAEAKALLQDGLSLAHGSSGFTMPLARLQVADGNKEQALSTLKQGLVSASDDAEYHTFLAALLQEQGSHDEAVKHYIIALRINPSMPNALIGVGVSLRTQNKMNEAAEAFQRAIDTGELTPAVAQFAEQQLKQIHPQP